MKHLKSILSLFLLCTHVLLLLHDFVPHSHHEDDNSVEHFQHSHSGHDHHHSSNDDYKDHSSKNNLDGFTDSSSERDFHSHNVSYLATSKSELLHKFIVANIILSDFWKFTENTTCKIDYNDFSPPLKSNLVANDIGLRAPPVLG